MRPHIQFCICYGGVLASVNRNGFANGDPETNQEKIIKKDNSWMPKPGRTWSKHRLIRARVGGGCFD